MNDKTAQRFGEVFRRFFETGYMDDLAELFQGESKVIVYLSTAEGIVYPSDISRDLMISRQRATSVLSAMEKKGFVCLVRDPEDKRPVTGRHSLFLRSHTRTSFGFPCGRLTCPKAGEIRVYQVSCK